MSRKRLVHSVYKYYLQENVLTNFSMYNGFSKKIITKK